MEEKLLFINHSKNEINEFTRVMSEKGFEIDTAETGVDAGILLKKNTYGVIILDMYLKGFDGEKLIKYMNRSHPDTVCIVYTYTLTKAELLFLVNQRNIFRIFINPIDFLEEMLPAIEEAFDIYGVNFVQRKTEMDVEKRISDGRRKIEEKSAILGYQEKGRQQFLAFSAKILEETMHLADLGLSEEEKGMLLQFEKELLNCTGDILEKPYDNFQEIKEKLEREFAKNGRCQKFRFVSKCREAGYSKTTFAILYVSLWILLKQYRDFFQKDEIRIEISAESENRLSVLLQITMPQGLWEKGNREMEMFGEKHQIVDMAVEEMVDFCECDVKENEIVYRMKIENKF
ncbi:MAG: response regulator [Lachnospiraceae bacterium]|nr:response regulator [Lachnospiraceae bacterium]